MKRSTQTAKTRGTAGIVTLFLILSLLLSACGAKPGTMSPENTVVTTAEGVTVDVGDFVLDGEATLSVTKGTTEDHSDEGYKIDAYEIKLGDLHELGDYITIRIPYDTTYCEKGQDPAKCVGAKYMNETTGEWEDVLFEVDAEKQELVIYADHLSYYGALYVDNEGRRDALVTDVLHSPLYMDKSTAMAFAGKIAANDTAAKKELSDYAREASDAFFDYADRADNAINIATLGEVPEWLSTEIPETNQTMFSALGYIATASNLMRIAAQETLGGGADKGAVLNLIRDVGSKVTTYWAESFTSLGSGALSVGMGGVMIIDKMLTAFAEEAKATKMEDVSYIYHHYNEGFTSAPWAHKLMKPKDWREKVIQVLEKHPDDPDVAISALEAGFNKYASEFFTLSPEQMAEVASDTPNVTVKRIPNLTAAEQQQLIDDYVAHLKNTTMPAVLKSVQNYMVRKSEEAQLSAINEIKKYYNSPIAIQMQEPLEAGAKSQYAGYKFRFAPLNETAQKSNWTGTWPESGQVRDTATLIGFMTAGYPHTVEFFKPDANMDTGEPEFTVPFVISVPSITINVSAAPSFDEIVGEYADGTLTISDFYVSDETRQAIANSGKDNEYGCDLSEILTSIEEQKGQKNDMPFTITKTGENVGKLLSKDGEGAFDLTYTAGVLTLHYAGDGATLDGTGKAQFKADRTGIEISGELYTDFGYGIENLKLTLLLAGTKPLS